MPWWGWIAVGGLLLVAELMILDLEFYLVFLGISALTVGLAELAGFGLPGWAQWVGFAVLSVVSMVTVRRRLYDKIHANTLGLEEPLVGETVRITEELAPGATARVQLRGTDWTVRNVGDAPIAAGSTARVERSEGLTLSVRA